jgi:8-oxo-dGTP pyrophosphatase MutT (NUDIX family)
MRARNLLHRSVFILCCDPEGRIYVHRRTRTKDLFPGLYDMFVGGVVGSGESYAHAAVREVAEELGIVDTPLSRLFHHRYEGPHTRAHIEVFQATWEGPITHQASEIDWGAYCTLDELIANRERRQFVPDGEEIFARYLRQRGR